jgi:putative ABC transport system permease protein
MASRLQTKLRRDLWVGKWQFLAVAFIVTLGVAMFEAGFVSFRNMSESYNLSYQRLRFADFWIPFDRAPQDIVRRIAELPGVVSVVGRINEEVPLRISNESRQNVVGRFIGLPARARASVNDVRLVKGRYFSPSGKREALVEASFAKHHKYEIGDTITAEVGGGTEQFRIVGFVISPEYIVALRNKQYGMPTPSLFGVIFIPDERAEDAFQMSGQINEVCARVTPGMTKSQRNDLMWQAHDLLMSYGAEDPVPQEEQASNHGLQTDLKALSSLATMFPTLFLIAAAMTIYTLLMRLVFSQRPHIGFLRASGFTQASIIAHYTSYAVVVGLLGGLMGVALGYYLGLLITNQYTTTLNIPYIATPFRWDAVSWGCGLAMFACLAAGYIPARAAGKLPPAVAMRDEAPPMGRRPFLEWLFPPLARLPYVIKIPMRNLFRTPRRTIYTAFGIASGVSLVMVSAMFLDAIDYAINSYFRDMQKYDALVQFLPPQSEDVAYHLAQWPGVRRAEPGLQLPVELIKDDNKFSTLLLALPRQPRLFRIPDANGKAMETLKSDDLLVGRLIRERLGLETGDLVLLRYSQSSEDMKAEAWVRVGEPIQQPATTIVYLPIDVAQRLFGSALDLPVRPATGIQLQVEPQYLDAVRRELYDLPHAAAVELTRDTKADLDKQMAFTYAFIGTMLMFGVGLAFAIVFNTLSINILERTRELASMRTLGLRRSQMTTMATIENVLTAALGLLLGLPIGYAECVWFVRLFQSETVSLELIIYPRTYALVIVGTVIVVLLSQIPALRWINRLDLAKATKERSG